MAPPKFEEFFSLTNKLVAETNGILKSVQGNWYPMAIITYEDSASYNGDLLDGQFHGEGTFTGVVRQT